MMRPSCALVALALTVGCGSGPGSAPTPPPSQDAGPRAAVSLDRNAYPVFPAADAGADPSVPAALGGRGFTGDGWLTSTDFELIGDPRAVKGGVIREAQLDFPGTLRIYGPESNTVLNGAIQDVVYEGLLTVHPTTLEFIPGLASHWQVSEDKLTYRYRIDPNARFSDGQPVTADDVVASWALVMDKGLQEPMSQLVYAKFDKPVAESKYIVRVKCNQLNWRNFLYFSASLPILPAHILKSIDGAFVREGLQFQAPAGHRPLHRHGCRRGQGQVVSAFDAARTTGPRTTVATSAATTSTKSARSSSATTTFSSRCSRRAISTTSIST